MKSLEAFREVEPGSDGTDRLSLALGWSSVGMGAAQLAVPGAIAGVLGLMPSGRASMATRIMGLANLGIGAGLLLRPRQGSRMWARVAGDAIGLGLLAWAFRGSRSSAGRVAGTLAASAGMLAVDALAARRMSRASKAPAPLVFAVTINKPPSEVHAFFRKLENLPRFMEHLESVRSTGDRRSHWTANGPAGRSVEWDAEVIAVTPNELIEWRSVEGSDMHNSGVARFTPAPGLRGTEVHLEMEYDSPGGKLGETVAKLLGEDPVQQVKDDLRRFKQVLETGEIVRSDASAVRGKQPAQPSERAARRARAQSRRMDKLAAREVTR